MIEEYQTKSNLAKEIMYCGIGNYDSVLHFGACDKDLFFLETLDEHELDIQYTAVDIKEEVEKLFTTFEPITRTMPWITVNQPMQEYIDDIEDERYTWTLLTGVFDKPIYSERQYQFIDTVIRSCFEFSDNVLFTINQQATPVYKYSIVYLFQHFNQEYDKVTVKKVEQGKYIFCINN